MIRRIPALIAGVAGALNRRTAFAAVSALAMFAALPASAAIFSDDFNLDTPGLNYTAFVRGWTVTDGTVDLIGQGFFDFIPGNGFYVDLDGSTSNAGVLTKSLTLTAGVSYTASFALAGSQRGDSNTVTVSFGSSLASFPLGAFDPLTTRTLAFTPSSDGTYALAFSNAGGDNFGALLDNVVVEAGAAPGGGGSAAPEPSTWAMLLIGFGGSGAVLRRRGANVLRLSLRR